MNLELVFDTSTFQFYVVSNGVKTPLEELLDPEAFTSVEYRAAMAAELHRLAIYVVTVT